MSVSLQSLFKKDSNRKVIVTAIIIFVVVQFGFSIQLIASTLDYDRIYKGIYINDINVSGLTTKEAEDLINETYKSRIENVHIAIKAKEITQNINAGKIIKNVNVKEAVEKAYYEGRDGNFIERLSNITGNSIKGKMIAIDYEYDEAKIQQLIGKLSVVSKDFVNSSYQISEDKIVISFGQSGQTIDEAALREKLKEKVQKMDAGELETPLIVKKPDPIDVNKLHTEVYTEPKNAEYKVKDYKIAINPHITGRDFDKERARDLISAGQQAGRSIEIPLVLTEPKIMEDDLKGVFFKDKLASFNTKYNQGDTQRSENVRIAASNINEVVIGPGETFSYNEIVGERTSTRGFKMAHVYVGGKVVDGIGGGICQVSTTLYNTVLFADLEVIERRNHNMIVTYVRPGRDATVSYGSTDFKFKNNYKNPIKVLTSSGGGRLKIEILGTVENPNKKVELETEIIKSFSLPEKVIEDPTQPVGYYKVVQKGMRGYKASTYKIIKENGKVLSRKRISTDSYNALQRIVKKGTKAQDNS